MKRTSATTAAAADKEAAWKWTFTVIHPFCGSRKRQEWMRLGLITQTFCFLLSFECPLTGAVFLCQSTHTSVCVLDWHLSHQWKIKSHWKWHCKKERKCALVIARASGLSDQKMGDCTGRRKCLLCLRWGSVKVLDNVLYNWARCSMGQQACPFSHQ